MCGFRFTSGVLGAARFTRRGLLALILSTALFAQAPAGNEGVGKLISIEAAGSNRFSADQIAAASGLHTGETVRQEDLQAAANRLAQLGRFTEVRYRFSTQEQGVILDFQVADAEAVPVVFDNFPWFTDDELTQALKRSVPLFDGTAPTQGSALEAMDDALEKVLATRGVHASVEHQLLRQPDSDVDMQLFRVVGAALKVEDIEYSDPLATSDSRVRQQLGDILGKPFSRFTIELFNFEHVRPIYLEHAHLRVKFGRPHARFRGNPNEPLPRTVVAIVPVTPGPVYSWGGATWSGNVAIPTTDLDKLVDLQPGAPADGMKLLGAWDRVRNAYAESGYLDLKVDVVPQFDDAAARVSYRVSIAEGTQYHMGKLVLTGLSIEGERRIRAAWTIAPRQVFNRAVYEQFLATGIQKAFGDLPAHYEKIGRWLRTNPQTATVDVLLDFQ